MDQGGNYWTLFTPGIWKVLHAVLHFYASIPGSNAMLLRDVAGWLLTKGGERVVASDFTSGVRACRGMSLTNLARLIDPLITGDWLVPEDPYPGNRAWKFAQAAVQAAFSERARAETERRAEARALIRRMDGEAVSGQI